MTAGPDSVKVRVTKLVERGLARYGAGQLHAALAEWEHALALDPENARAEQYIKYVRENFSGLEAAFETARQVADQARQAGVPLGDVPIPHPGKNDRPGVDDYAEISVVQSQEDHDEFDSGWDLEGVAPLPPPPEGVSETASPAPRDDATGTFATPAPITGSDLEGYPLADLARPLSPLLPLPPVPGAAGAQPPSVEDDETMSRSFDDSAGFSDVGTGESTMYRLRENDLSMLPDGDSGSGVNLNIPSFDLRNDGQENTGERITLRRRQDSDSGTGAGTGTGTNAGERTGTGERTTLHYRPGEDTGTGERTTMRYPGGALPPRYPGAGNLDLGSRPGTNPRIGMPGVAGLPGLPGLDDEPSVEVDPGLLPVFDLVDPETSERMADDGITGVRPSPEAARPEDARERVHIEGMITAAREALERGDHDGALDNAEIAMRAAGDGRLATATTHRHRDLFARIFEAFLGPTTQVPAICVPVHQLGAQDLDHRAAFLLSRIDGSLTIEEILDIAGMARFDALRLLASLVRKRFLEVR